MVEYKIDLVSTEDLQFTSNSEAKLELYEDRLIYKQKSTSYSTVVEYDYTFESDMMDLPIEYSSEKRIDVDFLQCRFKKNFMGYDIDNQGKVVVLQLHFSGSDDTIVFEYRRLIDAMDMVAKIMKWANA